MEGSNWDRTQQEKSSIGGGVRIRQGLISKRLSGTPAPDALHMQFCEIPGAICSTVLAAR